MEWAIPQGRFREILLALICGVCLAVSIVVLSSRSIGTNALLAAIGMLGGLILALVTHNVRYLLLLLIMVDGAYNIDVNLNCNQQYMSTACGYNLSLTLFALIGLYGLWFFELRHSTRPHFTLGYTGIAGVLFIGAEILSLVGTQRMDLSLYQLWQHVIQFLLFFYLLNNIRSKQDIWFLLYFIGIGLAVQLPFMELQNFGLSSRELGGDISSKRVFGTLDHPNIAGGYLIQALSILLAALYLPMPFWRKILLIMLLLIAGHALLGTESRASWISLALGLVIIGIVGLWKKWLVGWKAFIAIMVLIAFLLAGYGTIITRFTEDDKGSAQARGPLAEIAFNMIHDNPLTGVGLNNFGVVLHDYIEEDQYGAWLSLVHNGWLLVWSETGTIAFVLYVCFWLSTGWQAFKLLRGDDPFYAMVALACLTALIVMAVYMNQQISHRRVLMQMVWIEVAMICAMARMQREATEGTTRAVTSFIRVSRETLKQSWANGQ